MFDPQSKYYNICEKVITIDKRDTDLTWFTNNVLATSTDRKDEEFYSE